MIPEEEKDKYIVTDSQKECCAILTMRAAVGYLAKREKIPYAQALLKFTSSNAYDALFDYSTEIWKEGPIYLLWFYDQCEKHKKIC